MLSASAEYKQKMSQNSKVLFKATLTLANGTVRNLVGDDVMGGTPSFCDAVSSDGSFDVGAAIVNQFTLTLNNFDGRFDDYDFTDATIVPYVGVELDAGGVEWLLKGHYGVEQPRSYGSTIQLRSLDNMRKFETPYADVSTSYPATLRTIVSNICSACGVTLYNTAFANSTYVVQSRPTEELTCLEMIGYAAQVAGCFARVRADGKLELKWYDTSVFEGASAPDRTRCADISAVSSLTVSTDDVVITGVSVKACDEVESDGSRGDGGETYLQGSAGYVLAVEGNPLVLFGQAQAVAQMIGARVVGMRFRPFDAQAVGSPVYEAGDPAILTDSHGTEYWTYLTSLTYKSQAYEAFACDAETPSRNKAASFSALTRAVVESRNAVKVEKTAREQAIADLAEQLAESSGLFMTAQVQQDHSTIYYMHDKPTLAESQIVWKLTANALGISTDGGTTYPYGLDVSGTAILNRIYAIGLDADYINTGALTIRDGNLAVFSADADTGVVVLQDASGNHWNMHTGELTIANTASFVDEHGNPISVDDIIEAASDASDLTDEVAEAKAAAAAADAKVDALSIGGTNLLTGTNVLTKIEQSATWDKLSWGGTSSGTGSRKVVNVTNAPNNAIKRGFCIQGNGTSNDVMQSGVPITPNEDYVLSCYAKMTSTAAKLYMAVGNGSTWKTASTNLTTGWKRYYLSFRGDIGGADITNGKTTVVFGNHGAGGYAYICGMKLERGTKATDWSENPFDTENRAVDAATQALDKAKTYTNQISATDREYTAAQRRALDASFNQAQIFKRLTNNGQTQGIYLKNGRVYINGSYIQSGTVNAGIVKAGILSDTQGKNKWNMATGYLETRNMVAKNANVDGQVTAGPAAGTHLALQAGRLDGYHADSNGRTRIGYIAPTAKIWLKDAKRYAYGIQMQSQGILRISSPRIGVLNSSDTSKTTTTAFTGTITLHNVVFGMNRNMTSCKWGDVSFKFINGLLVSYSKPNGM